jgi:hypothetical protein
MQSGLPVLANINAGNDLVQVITEERVGQVCDNNRLEDLLELTEKLLCQIGVDNDLHDRCKSLFTRDFRVDKTVKQILKAIETEQTV